MEKLDAFVQKIPDSRLFRSLGALQKTVLIIAGVVVFLLTIVTVFLRYILKMNVLGLDEVILIVIFWLYFFGAAQGSMEDSQIKADMISTVVKSKKVVVICHFLARVIECAVILVCIKWAVDYLVKDSSVMPYTVVLSIPLAVSHIAMLFGFLLMMVYHLYWLLAEFSRVLHIMRGEKIQ